MRHEKPLMGTWVVSAGCRGLTHLFFAPAAERPNYRERREKAARGICEVCPVLRECGEYVLSYNEEHGIWAGMDENERRTERRRRQRNAAKFRQAQSPEQCNELPSEDHSVIDSEP